MREQEHQRQVLRTLEKMMERDHAKTSITGVSELGLGGNDSQAHPRIIGSGNV